MLRFALAVSAYVVLVCSGSLPGDITQKDSFIGGSEKSTQQVDLEEIVKGGMRFMLYDLVPYLESADPGFNFNHLPRHLRTSVYALRSAGVPDDLMSLILQYIDGFRENLMKKRAVADSLLSSMRVLRTSFPEKISEADADSKLAYIGEISGLFSPGFVDDRYLLAHELSENGMIEVKKNMACVRGLEDSLLSSIVLTVLLNQARLDLEKGAESCRSIFSCFRYSRSMDSVLYDYMITGVNPDRHDIKKRVVTPNGLILKYVDRQELLSVGEAKYFSSAFRLY
jgi:hypothetical protein